jgi:hypothetical protein
MANRVMKTKTAAVSHRRSYDRSIASNEQERKRMPTEWQSILLGSNMQNSIVEQLGHSAIVSRSR